MFYLLCQVNLGYKILGPKFGLNILYLDLVIFTFIFLTFEITNLFSLFPFLNLTSFCRCSLPQSSHLPSPSHLLLFPVIVSNKPVTFLPRSSLGRLQSFSLMVFFFFLIGTTKMCLFPLCIELMLHTENTFSLHIWFLFLN